MAEYKTQVEQYRLFEINLTGTTEGNPYQDVTLSADFTNAETGQIVVVGGFYRGNGNYSVRFMQRRRGGGHSRPGAPIRRSTVKPASSP